MYAAGSALLCSFILFLYDGTMDACRYVRGGNFPAHEDGYSITINVLLDSGSFQGGGTEFWTEPHIELKSLTEPIICTTGNVDTNAVASTALAAAGGAAGGSNVAVDTPFQEQSAAGNNAWGKDGEEGNGASIRIEPLAPGCAIIFNGNVRHQGKTVQSGVRYLYVASFDLS